MPKRELKSAGTKTVSILRSTFKRSTTHDIVRGARPTLEFIKNGYNGHQHRQVEDRNPRDFPMTAYGYEIVSGGGPVIAAEKGKIVVTIDFRVQVQPHAFTDREDRGVNQEAADAIARDLAYALFKWAPSPDVEKGTERGARRVLSLWAGDGDGSDVAGMSLNLRVRLSSNRSSKEFVGLVKLAS